jgi:hypothetical protein
MRNIKTKRKSIALLLALSLSLGALAQGGLFQRGDEPGLHRSDGAALLTNQTFGNSGNGNVVTNQTFGNPTDGVNVTNQTFGAPLGSGLIILLVASASYSTLKSNKRNNKSKKENIK